MLLYIQGQLFWHAQEGQQQSMLRDCFKAVSSTEKLNLYPKFFHGIPLPSTSEWEGWQYLVAFPCPFWYSSTCFLKQRLRKKSDQHLEIKCLGQRQEPWHCNSICQYHIYKAWLLKNRVDASHPTSYSCCILNQSANPTIYHSPTHFYSRPDYFYSN